MGTAAGMIKAMRAMVGTTEHPPGSNHNEITVWYNQHVDRIGDGAWCDMTVSKAAADSGNADAVGQFAYTVYHARSFLNRGLWHVGMKGIKPGAVVFYDWSGHKGLAAIDYIDHVGLVTEVSGDRFKVVEGNIGDRCQELWRDSTYLVGYGMPRYDVPKLVAPNGTPLLREGSSGARVVLLQRVLNTVNLGHTRLETDGSFGPLTKAGLKIFQKNHKDAKGKPLEVDGVWGENSEAAAKKALG